jgi:hypothetical protein
MRKFDVIFLSAFLVGLPACRFANALQAPQTASPAQALLPTVTIPTATKIELVLTRPIKAASAKVGDAIYAQTSFPVLVSGGMAIPAGSYVEGTIAALTPPTRKSNRAVIQVLFTKIVFPNGYVIVLPGGIADAPAAATGTDVLPADTLIAITVQVSVANDLLLDNGAQIEMALGAPVMVDAKQVAQSIPLAQPPKPGQFKSATLCRTIPGTPGTPGTPDIVIPGTPGTPDTVIPGGPGMPDTVIPGIPATQATVISGSPGTPGTADIYCPSKPLVISCALVVKTPRPQPVAAR